MALVMPVLRAYLVRSESPNWNGLRAMLDDRRDFTVVGDSTNVGEAQAQVPSLRPDVIVSAIEVGGESVIPLLSHLHAHMPDVRIVLFAGRYDLAELHRLGSLHIAGYFLWDDLDHVAFSGAFDATCSGGFTVGSRAVANAFLDGTLSPYQLSDEVTEREHTILGGLAAGRTREEIAADEHLSRSTVDRTIAGLFDRFGVSSSNELISEAARRGLLR